VSLTIFGASLEPVGVHRAAGLGYQRAAAVYERVRPSYPTAALAVLADALDLRAGRRVVDLGAGTGKFTRLLALTGAEVLAVEPVAAMRSWLAEILPQVDVVAGTAERTGLDDASVDAAIAAQAWHWFDASKALAEIERVVRPGGALGLLWNTLDESVPWVSEYSAVYRSWRPSTVPGHRDGQWRRFFRGLPGWEPLEERHVPNPYPTDREGVIGQALTSSHIATLDDTDRAKVQADLEAVLDGHPESSGDRVEIPYVTDVYWTHRI
jgi:SAM-dependent methyltransferase